MSWGAAVPAASAYVVVPTGGVVGTALPLIYSIAFTPRAVPITGMAILARVILPFFNDFIAFMTPSLSVSDNSCGCWVRSIASIYKARTALAKTIELKSDTRIDLLI